MTKVLAADNSIFFKHNAVAGRGLKLDPLDNADIRKLTNGKDGPFSFYLQIGPQNKKITLVAFDSLGQEAAKRDIGVAKENAPSFHPKTFEKEFGNLDNFQQLQPGSQKAVISLLTDQYSELVSKYFHPSSLVDKNLDLKKIFENNRELAKKFFAIAFDPESPSYKDNEIKFIINRKNEIVIQARLFYRVKRLHDEGYDDAKYNVEIPIARLKRGGKMVFVDKFFSKGWGRDIPLTVGDKKALLFAVIKAVNEQRAKALHGIVKNK